MVLDCLLEREDVLFLGSLNAVTQDYGLNNTSLSPSPEGHGLRRRGSFSGRARRGLLLALPAVVLEPGDDGRVRLAREGRRLQHDVGRSHGFAVGVHGAGAVGVGVPVQTPVARKEFVRINGFNTDML